MLQLAKLLLFIQKNRPSQQHKKCELVTFRSVWLDKLDQKRRKNGKYKKGENEWELKWANKNSNHLQFREWQLQFSSPFFGSKRKKFTICTVNWSMLKTYRHRFNIDYKKYIFVYRTEKWHVKNGTHFCNLWPTAWSFHCKYKHIYLQRTNTRQS